MHKKTWNYPSQSDDTVIIGKESRLGHGGWEKERILISCDFTFFNQLIFIFAGRHFLIYYFTHNIKFAILNLCSLFYISGLILFCSLLYSSSSMLWNAFHVKTKTDLPKIWHLHNILSCLCYLVKNAFSFLHKIMLYNWCLPMDMHKCFSKIDTMNYGQRTCLFFSWCYQISL